MPIKGQKKKKSSSFWKHLSTTSVLYLRLIDWMLWCVCSRNVRGGYYGAEPSHRNPHPLWAGQEPEAREAHAVPGRWRDRPQSHGGRRRSGQSQEVGRDVPYSVSYFPQSVFYHEPRTKPVTNHLFPNALNRDHANKVQPLLLECVCMQWNWATVCL